MLLSTLVCAMMFGTMHFFAAADDDDFVVVVPLTSAKVVDITANQAHDDRKVVEQSE
jgi:hypothetical protein